jgi:NAD(P)-dependent dehydrogenase (short-subunit alcohol dehydrogenase family)
VRDRFDLTGKVVVVTGGSRGLGRVMSEAFAEHGAAVVLASRKEKACQEAAADIEAATGRRSVGIGCHVGRWEDCDRLVERVYAEFGRIDVLVNNAGMSPLYPSLPDVTEELFDKVISVNLKGAFRLSSVVGTRMAESTGGAIINVSSVAAVNPTPAELPYAAAKAGLNTLTVGFARAFAPRVRVNTIMAGLFLTDISQSWPEGFAKTAEAAIMLGRAAQPDEIVGTALYLATDASSFTTGAIIRVDGGMASGPA